jgi:hypothetical protein
VFQLGIYELQLPNNTSSHFTKPWKKIITNHHDNFKCNYLLYIIFPVSIII